jgi:hypothetical protein
LGTGVGDFASGVFEVEDLDPRLGDVEHSVILEGAGHLALQTAGTFVGVDVQRFLHDASSYGYSLNMRKRAYSRPQQMLL